MKTRVLLLSSFLVVYTFIAFSQKSAEIQPLPTTEDKPGFKRGVVEANGLTFSFLELGEGPLVLALHGFPDHPRTFRYQIKALADAGFRVVVPFMRGYAPTEAPGDVSYESAALAQDAVALIEALQADSVILMGHDWGAVAAHQAARIAPEKVSKLITMAVPYSTQKPFIENPAQQRRSWYMFFFQMPFAEKAVAHNDYLFIEKLWQDWSPEWKYPIAELDSVKATFRKPGVLQAALNYYRHSFYPPGGDLALEKIRQGNGQPIYVPTLYIHGQKDGCIGIELMEGNEALFPEGIQKVIIPEAGHFVQQEKPDEVNRLILDFLNK